MQAVPLEEWEVALDNLIFQQLVRTPARQASTRRLAVLRAKTADLDVTTMIARLPLLALNVQVEDMEAS